MHREVFASNQPEMVAKHPQPAVISHTIHGEHQNRVFWAGILNRDDKGIEILLPTCVYIYIYALHCITLVLTTMTLLLLVVSCSSLDVTGY